MIPENVFSYEFDEFLLSPTERLLLKAGVRCDLKGKDLDVLVYLIKKQLRLVTHQELLDEVWSGSFVEPGNITTSISKIRKILGDNSRKPKYIESIKGYGYRFLVPAKVISNPEPNLAGRRDMTAAHK